MSRHIAGLLLCCIAALANAGEGASPRQAPSSEEIRQQYAAALAKADKVQSEEHAKNAEFMDRTDAMLTQREQMMKRQEEDFARFEKILDTWERQQAQYQKYLDSLGHK